MLTLTQTGPDFEAIRGTLNRFREYCCRLGGRFEWFWVAEHNPRRPGTHVHAWMRTDGLDVKIAYDAAGRAGLGSVLDLEKARERLGPVGSRLDGVGRAAYVLKEALSGPGDGSSLAESQEAFLALNGGRLGHSSRGFWLDRFGRRLHKVREAEQEAGRMRPAHRRGVPVSAGGPPLVGAQ